MRNLAQQFEFTLKPVSEADLRRVGASCDDSGLWTFPDASQGRILARPVVVYNDAQQSELLGRCWFEAADDMLTKAG